CGGSPGRRGRSPKSPGRGSSSAGRGAENDLRRCPPRFGLTTHHASWATTLASASEVLAAGPLRRGGGVRAVCTQPSKHRGLPWATSRDCPTGVTLEPGLFSPSWTRRNTVHIRLNVTACAAALALLVVSHTHAEHINERHGIRHVLLISIDGMHALDYTNCVQGGYCPALEALGTTGVNYTRTSTSRPSDSFPGLMALVTGGTPRTVGAFYDVAYDRVLA